MTYLRMRVKKAAFVTGGIGEDSPEAMKRAREKYPLALSFVGKSSADDVHLSDVDVTIKDHRGNTQLRTMTDSPYLLAKLPDGQYTVTALYDGRSEVRQVTVAAARPQQVVFAW